MGACACAQVTTGNLERVRKVKTRHQRLWTRVVTVREELQARPKPVHPNIHPVSVPGASHLPPSCFPSSYYRCVP